MASTPPTPANGVSGKADPLAFMTRLNSSVSVYRPAATDAASAVATSAPGPRVVLLCTWMGALSQHIVKYVEPYREQYPSTVIVLARAEPSHFIRPQTLSDVEAALDVLRAEFPELKDAAEADLAASTAGTPPPLLIHLWSNGGSNVLGHMNKKMRDFPPYSIVYDSAPGQFHYRATGNAMLLTLPPVLRRWLLPAVHLMVGTWWLRSRVERLFGYHIDPLTRTAAAHNSPARLAVEMRRSYVYGDGDALIMSSDVEAHAADAEHKGAKDVRLEKFGGVHVGHMRVDPARYWHVVRETLYGRGAVEEMEEEEGAVVVEANGHAGNGVADKAAEADKDPVAEASTVSAA